MERATKLFVVVWVSAALSVDVWLMRVTWPRLLVIAPAGAALAAALTAIDRRAVGLVLALAYILPVIVSHYVGSYYTSHSVLWMVLLFGAIAPDSILTPWRIPARWRGPLLCWALVVAMGASIVVAREIDFTPALFLVTSVSNTVFGGWPSFVVGWVLQVAVVSLLGILWFDWLMGARDEQFHAGVVTPLAISFLGLAAVAAYQLFGDLRFLNRTAFAYLGRATGTVFDANVCGTIAAIWIGASVLWAERLGRWRWFASVAGMVLGWIAVWASGSRTAFFAAIIVTAFTGLALVTAPRQTSHSRALVQWAAILAAAAAIVGLLRRGELSAVGPIARLRSTLPEASMTSIKAALKEEFWNRNGYGAASTEMIRRYPWFGVGVGSFQTILPEFAIQVGVPLPPDNAQNWYRHQLAEIGTIGSIGWILWVIGFGLFVLGRNALSAPTAWAARGVLIAFAAISFVGMPGQEAIVAITFWTIAAWYVRLAGGDATGAGNQSAMRRGWWLLTAGILVVYASGSTRAATTELRVPVRAQRVGWPYSYGFHASTIAASDEMRWTGRRAVAVVKVSAQWLALTVAVDHRTVHPVPGRISVAHAPTRPVDVKVWCDGRLVLENRLMTTAPETVYVPVPAGERWVLLETWVSRVLTPRELGTSDDREFGLLIKWSFVAAPADGHVP